MPTQQPEERKTLCQAGLIKKSNHVLMLFGISSKKRTEHQALTSIILNSILWKR
ncbi:hypothetical protein rv5_gp163 [Escherichia phage V5]|uniref:Uncharacterized protein n=1 Tax=Escherichia phage V5 TaxID=399183 RepID=B3RGV2_9CAUD|nr:hypothetical protein rv5_gp163 [Escherichia phage V5]ABI79233.1 hypothetical protein [Escherichia phage V5]